MKAASIQPALENTILNYLQKLMLLMLLSEMQIKCNANLSLKATRNFRSQLHKKLDGPSIMYHVALIFHHVESYFFTSLKYDHKKKCDEYSCCECAKFFQKQCSSFITEFKMMGRLGKGFASILTLELDFEDDHF